MKPVTSRVVAVLALWSAVVALADPPKPRVMVIMDTSKSMTEKPVFATPADQVCNPFPGACIPSLPNDSVTLSTPGKRGDYDPALNNACDSKFCAAKSVIYNVLPNFVDDARIGISTYYQYTVKADMPDNRKSKCSYDVLAPAGLIKSFTSTFDYTGGGVGDTCAAAFATCSKTANAYFPDSTGTTGSSLLRGLCKPPFVGPVASPLVYSTPADPLTTPTACQAGSPNCYQLVKTGVAPASISCALNNWPAPTLAPTTSITSAQASWCTTGIYTTQAPTSPVIMPAAGSYQLIVSPTVTSCGTAVPQSVMPPAPTYYAGNIPAGANVANAVKVTGAFATAATTVNKWLTGAAPVLAPSSGCSATYPCTMFVANSTPNVTNTARHWYLFTSSSSLPAFTAAGYPVPGYPGAYGPGKAYTLSSATATTSYMDPAAPPPTTPTTGNFVNNVPAATSCLNYPSTPIASVGSGSIGSVGRYTSGDLATTFGISTVQTQLAAALPPPVAVPASVDDTPGKSAGGYACGTGASGQVAPCDVTVVDDVPVPGVWNKTTIYTLPGSLAANQNVCNSASGTCNLPPPVAATASFTYHATNPSVVTCPAPTSAGAAPSNTVWNAAPAGCGTGTAACQWTLSSGPTQVAAGVGVCPTVTVYTASPSIPTCSYNGKAYGTPVNQTQGTLSSTVLATANCPNTTTYASAAALTTAGLSGSGCGGFPCDVTANGSTAAAPLPSPVSYDITAVPTGFSTAGAPTQSYPPVSAGVPGIVTDSSVGVPSSADTCPGLPGTQVQASGALCPNGSGNCTLEVVGMAVVGNACTVESGTSCYSCQYKQLQFVWNKAQKTCNYTTQPVKYTVDQNATTCVYTRDQWQLETQALSTHNCKYAVGAARADFVQENLRTCSMWMLQSTFTAPRNVYTYNYQTNGDELIGRGSFQTPAGTGFCSLPYTGNIDTSCPETVANCTGITPATNWMPASFPAGATCKLRYGGGAGTPANNFGLNDNTVLANVGRYATYASTTATLPRQSYSSATSATCEGPSILTPASPDLYKDDTAAITGFCRETGTPAASTYALVSDWYDPTKTNSTAAFGTVVPTPFPVGSTISTNNTVTKAQGMGGAAVPAVIGPGTVPSRSVFVPIPNEASYVAATQRAAIQKVAMPCVPPSVTPPAADGSLAGGACLSDMVDPMANIALPPGHSKYVDVTPLYGSLRNAYDYLVDRYQNDENATSCRKYFIILATDGAEYTPANYSVTGSDPATSVEGLVGSFRHAVGKPDVGTFVIAFGEGAASVPGLNAVAAAGGTGAAFSAATQSELALALRTVFTTITQGTYSRSKPALGTDGTRLYAAQFSSSTTTLSGQSPDWTGLMTAYRISSNGDPMPAWEFSAKLDAQASRTIKVGLLKKSDLTTKVVGNFDTGNAELMDQLDDCTTCSIPYDPAMSRSALIDFLTVKGKFYFLTSGSTLASNVRTSAAGPIVNSSPIVVGKSPFDISYGGTNATARQKFLDYTTTTTATRGTRVMFQSNDGQTHSVVEGSSNAACTSLGESDPTCPNGTEAWAFVPGLLSGGATGSFGQPMLAQQLYQPYVGGWDKKLLNGALSVADVCTRSGDAQNCDTGDWRTIAIGTQREGGRGVYALDVTTGATPDTAKLLWSFSDGDLGFTWSIPAVGRVSNGGKEVFIAVFGAGKDDPNTGDLVHPDFEGNHVYALDALTGAKIGEYSRFSRGDNWWNVDKEVINRPAMWRRQGQAFMDSIYLGFGNSLYTMRFAKHDGTQWDNDSKWEPDELFDPTSDRNDDLATNLSVKAVVNKIVTTTPGTTTTPPVYALQSMGTLPMSGPSWWGISVPPIYNRPKLAAELVSSGSVPDLYVGTGDVFNPDTPSSEFFDGNFFYAVHDFNQQENGGHHSLKNDGRALWVVRFTDRASAGTGAEQVISEPAILAGCVVVATYIPPLSSVCGAVGDTVLYGFDPVTGALKQCLFYPSVNGIPTDWVGKSTSVVKLQGAGIPSDLVVVNDNVYLQSSNNGLQRAPARQMPQPGSVRSYRRLK